MKHETIESILQKLLRVQGFYEGLYSSATDEKIKKVINDNINDVKDCIELVTQIWNEEH